MTLNDVRLLLRHASIQTTLSYSYLEASDPSPTSNGAFEQPECRAESGQDQSGATYGNWACYSYFGSTWAWREPPARLNKSSCPVDDGASIKVHQVESIILLEITLFRVMNGESLSTHADK